MAVTAAQLSVVVSAEGVEQTKRALSDVGEKVKAHQGFFKSAASSMTGYIAGALGVAGVGNALGFVTSQLGDMLRAGLDANAVQAQTAAVLKSTHDASGMTAAAVDKLATGLMNMTGINDDAIAGAENVLLTFTSIGKKVFPDATKATADLATSMHIGLNQAALLVGKALNDPLQGITALRREGVQLSKTQEDQVKHFMAVGDKASAQKIILGELNKEFGGSAKAAGNANGGMKILSAQMAAAQQTIGQALIPAVAGLVSAIAPLIVQVAQKLAPAITQLSGYLKDHQGVVVGAAAIIGGVLVAAFAAWTISAASAAIATIAATWPVLAIIAAVAGLVIGIKLLVSHGDQVKAFFGHIGEAVGGALGWLGRLKDFVLADVLHAFKSLGDGIGHVWGGIQSTIKGAINGIIRIVNTYIGLLDAIQIHIPSVEAGPIHTPRFDWGGLGIPQIPLLASGGIISRAGLALVGENGPELLSLPRGAAVAPLGSAGGGGMGSTYNLQPGAVTIYTQATDGARIWREVKDAMAREGRKHNGR